MKPKNILYYFLSIALKTLLGIIFTTCRWKFHNEEVFQKAQRASSPILVCCWHSRFILVARYFKKVRLSVWAISSSHRDSEIMARVLRPWGFQLIRGSSTRGWRNVLKKMIALFQKEETIIALTNDGPQGPPQIAKRGSVMLALKKGAQIIAVSGAATKYWTINSWDQTMIPKPFSTIHIRFSPLFGSPAIIEDESAVVSEYINDNFTALDQTVYGSGN